MLWMLKRKGLFLETDGAAGGGSGSGFSDVSDAELQSAIDAEGETPAEPAEAEAAKPETFEVAGKTYTRAELEELLTKGTLRLQDYSKSKNDLEEQRRQFERERQEFIDSQRRPSEARPGEEDEDPEAPLTRQEFLQWQQEQAVERFKAHLSDVYDQTFDKLCTKHGITDPEMRELYDLHINGANPTLANAREVEQKVTELFEKYHERLGKLSKSAVDAEHGKLKKLPKPPSAKGEGAAPMATGDKPKKSFNDPITQEEIAGLTG